MAHPFEDLPSPPRAEEVIDQAFSRATRAGRAKSGVEAQRSMLQTAANVCSDNLENVVRQWPDLDAIDPFYRELADAVAADATDEGVDALRQHLNEVGWAGRKAGEIRREYEGRLAGDATAARKLRKQAFARLADVVEEVEGDLRALSEARLALQSLPEIDPTAPTIVVAGYPNVGKTTFVNHLTNANTETASYPFTTTQIQVGHLERDRIRYQLVDTPGLLDRPADERNEIESQAVSALTHVADAVLVIVDASESCGYPIGDQLHLRDAIQDRFDVPVLTVCNKADLSRAVDADHYMSLTDGDNVDTVLGAAIAAIEYQPELPYET